MGVLIHLSEKLMVEEHLTVLDDVAVTQKGLSLRVDKASHEKLLENTTQVEDKARLTSLLLPHCGDWLIVVPVPALGLRMRRPEFCGRW